jgi:hypothetical protein
MEFVGRIATALGISLILTLLLLALYQDDAVDGVDGGQVTNSALVETRTGTDPGRILHVIDRN